MGKIQGILLAGALLLSFAVIISHPVLADAQNVSAPETVGMATLLPTAPMPEPTPRVEVPVAEFTEDPFIGTAPLAVQFTDTSIGAPTSWQWDFGDGESSTDQDPLHTYASPGLYVVTLTVANSAGSSKTTGSERITVLVPPTTQSPLSPLAVSGAAGLAVLLAARRFGGKRPPPPVA